MARLSSFPKHFTAGNVRVSRELRSLKGRRLESLLTGFLIGLAWNALISLSFMSKGIRKKKGSFP